MANLMPTGKQQYFNNAGVPLSGGKIYTFEVGTTTPKATYSDAAGATPNANPVILNSRGEALIFWDGVYDVQVKDANDNLIYTVQNYSAQSDAASVSYAGASLDSILKNSVGKVVSSISALRAIDKTKNIKAFVTGYYADGDGGGGAYYYDAADASSADNGGTIIVAGDGGRWKLAHNRWVSVKQFGAKGDNLADDTNAILAARDWSALTKSAVYFTAGTYLCSATIDLSDKNISFIGDGPESVTLKAKAPFAGTLIKMLNTSNLGGNSCEVISGMTLLGNYSAGSVAIDQRLTSRATMRNMVVQGFETGIRQVDNFCFYGEQVEVKDCKYNWHLKGSNHNSEYVRCGSVGFGDSFGGVGAGLKIEYNGADAMQSSIAFRGCDFEFGAGNGAEIASTGTVIFDNCYMEGVGGTMFKVNDGDVFVLGGQYIIKDTTGYLVDPVGGNGRIVFDCKAQITSNGATRIFASLIKSGGSGSVVFRHSSVFTKLITTNIGVIEPNLGKCGIDAPYIIPQGRKWGQNPFTGNTSATVTGDTLRVTCTVAGAIGVYQQMARQPVINRNCVLAIRYRSNTTFSVTAVSNAGQSGPVKTIGALPNTAGALKIAIFPEARIEDPAQSWIEFWKAGSWSVGEYLEIEEVWLYDGDAIKNGVLALG